MKNKPQICVDPKDVWDILKISESAARKIIRDIKEVHDKKKHQKVTIKEFCAYMDLPFRDVFCMINKINSSDYESVISESGIEVPKREYLEKGRLFK